MQPGHMCCMLSHVPCRPCLLSHLSTVPVISYVGVWPFWANFIVAVFFSTISLQLIAEIFYSCIILSNKHLLFTYFLVSPDRPNDRWKSWGSFHCKKKKRGFWHSDLRQRGLNYSLPMYINDLFRVLLSFQTAEGHRGWMQHSESQQPCSESQHVSHSHTVFESLSQWKLPTLLNPFYYLGECHLDVLILIFCRSKFFQKRPTDSCQSFCINPPISSFLLSKLWEETSVTGFLKFRMSALPNKFGLIKIFPVQWINAHRKQPSGSLKMC